ncbi:MAG TPA: hypothetical protein VFQ67_00670 [Allosphingosinicella sp.]|jgi:hypothetical protein|nr:hypothetical protein [Allosphingosinicella sp.]
MKSGLFRSAACLLALAAAAACGDKGGSPSADATGAFAAAADALAGKLRSGAPEASDPAVEAFDAEAEKGLRTLGTPALPLRGLDSYDSLCGRTAKIVDAYVNLDLGQAPGAGKAEAKAGNAGRYFDRMFMPMLFSAHCSAAHMPFLEKTAGDDAATAGALKAVRIGTWGQVAGLLQMAGDPSLGPARRRRIVDLLAADAGDFAIILSPAQRLDLARTADTLRAALPEADKPKADAIKAGLAGAPCGPLCRG